MSDVVVQNRHGDDLQEGRHGDKAEANTRSRYDNGIDNQLRRKTMTDEHKQRLSELQDGELDSTSVTRLLDDFACDPSLRGSWERYHLIGQAIRGEPLDLEHRRIADAVRCALDAEPVILAHRRRRWPGRHQLQRAAGMALAASVAFAVFLMGPMFYQDLLQDDQPVASSPRFVERAVAPAPASTQRWHLNRPDVANKLDLFLVTHQATAPTTGAKGMLPYATLVGYELPR